jgi:hypothetical protein
LIVDVIRQEQVQRRERRTGNQGVEVDQISSTVPENGPRTLASDLACVANAEGIADCVTGKRSEVGENSLLPEKSVEVNEGSGEKISIAR